MESISRVSSMIEPTRDLTLDASALTASFRRTPNTSGASSTTSIPVIKSLLNSKHDREVLDGLRRFITLTQSPKRRADPSLASQLLPTILKNISSPNTHIRKLVYLVLVQHAESDQDTALLAINSIQKALSASDPHIRALALRTISSLRVPVIAQIVALGIKRGIGDMSPLVRKTAALAIPKCWRLDPSTAPQLEGYLSTLLGDRQYIVVGAACTASLETGLFETPDGTDTMISMLHSQYRGLCKKLVDMDDWGQCAALRVLAIYARRCFPQRTRRVKKAATSAGDEKDRSSRGFYDDDDTNEKVTTNDEYETILVTHPDLDLLLNSAQPLLQSRNPAVIIAVTRLYLALAPARSRETSQPPQHLAVAMPALLVLLRPGSTPSMTPLALHNLLQIALRYPAAFVGYTRHFLLGASDSATDAAPLKLEVLTLLFPHAPSHTQSLILAELSSAAHRRVQTSPSLLRAAISGIGRCAHAHSIDSKTSGRCLALLLDHVKAGPDSGLPSELAGVAASEALTQIRHLIQSNPNEHMSTVIQLAKDLDTTTQPKARAAIVWLVGEYAGTDMSSAVISGATGKGNIAADVLRILAKGFADEAEEVKLQICILAAKVYVHHLNSLPALPDASDVDAHNQEQRKRENHPIALLYAYIHSLIRYDTSYTLRDTARMHRALLPPVPLSTAASFSSTSSMPSAAANTQLATLLLLAPKPPPVTPSPATTRQGLELGSAALVLGDRNIPGYEAFKLPEWVREGQEPDPRLRDQGGDSGALPTFSRPVTTSEKFDNAGEVRVGPPVVKEKNLEDWLGEDEAESSSEENESEEGSTEEETDEETESEEEGSEEEGERDRLVG